LLEGEKRAIRKKETTKYKKFTAISRVKVVFGKIPANAILWQRLLVTQV
jgi:hypothetical protein